MVNVTNRADVAVRLVTRKFFLAHHISPSSAGQLAAD
jgi:hypothetical protein